MTIKQQGGVFGRNPTFNNAEVQNDLTVAGELGVKTTAPWEAISVPFNQKISVGSSLYPASFYRQSTGNLNTIFEDRYNVAATAMNFVMRAGSANEKTALSILGTGDVSLPVGNLVIGTSGKGIDFSATAGTGTSELFNDYEEGTWTPTFTAAWTTAPTVTSAQYTKVGRQVTVTMLATNGVVTAGGGIGGLPFTSNASQGAGAYGGNSDTTESIQGTVGQSASSITNIPARTLTGDTWQITATYFTT